MAKTEKVKKEVSPKPSINDYGSPGAPINRAHPFYFGFLATSGGLLALMVLRSLAAASQIFVLIIIALYPRHGTQPSG
ncbi:MAG: hypothetical protein WDO06_02120 [Actinomycetota bacterium]